MLYGGKKQDIRTCVYIPSSEACDSAAHGIIPDCFIYPEIDVKVLENLQDETVMSSVLIEYKEFCPQLAKVKRILKF